MLHLVAVSLLWAFSFGLIKGRLVGLDAAFISAARLALALLVFLPFLRVRGLSARTMVALAAIGAVQFGLMYLAYNASFQFLRAYEVALFTITTPIFVTLLADAVERTWRLRALAAAVLAVLGAALIVARSTEVQVTLTGLALVQLSNLAFAVGQVAYRRWRKQQPGVRDHAVFGLLYAGATLVAIFALVVRPGSVPAAISASQFWTLAYLGVLASGVGFFLWNLGATRVNAGTLAVMNNAKVPLAVACSIVFFGESAAEWPALLASLAVMGGAVWLAEKR